MEDSSGDDCPIGARDIVKSASRLLDEDGDSGASGSAMPDWISQHTPVQRSRPVLESSSSESEDIIDLVSPVIKKVTSKGTQEENDGVEMKDNSDGGKKAAKVAGPSLQKKKGATKAIKALTFPAAGLSQATPQISVVQGAAVSGGYIPITMPEKLAKGRYLVELEANEGGAADLAGDAGAVGRFSLSDASGKSSMLLDLKGAIYSANMVPCASTLCIINLQQTEAKVEALFDSFMSLREQTSSKGNSAEEGQNLFMFDDDENYQMADEDGEKGKKNTGKRKAAQDQDGQPVAKKKKGPVKVKGGKGAAGKAKPKAAKKKVPAKGGPASKK